jgi:peptide/nickel transport system substrate-binding protein
VAGALIARDFKKNENFFVSEDLVMGTYHMVMNNKAKPLDDPYVRKACAYAFNYEVAMNQIFPGGEKARGFLPKVLRGGCEDIVTYDYDLEKAKAMLKKSKYSAEELKKFEMKLGALSGNEMIQNVHLMLYSNLKKIGLNPKIVSVTWPQSAQRARKPETALHFFFFRQSGKVPHQLHFLNFFTKKFWGSAYPLGGMYYSNPKVEEAIEIANNSLDIVEQDRYYCIAQRQIAEDSPAIFSHTELRLVPFWRYVKGYKYPVGCEFWQWRFSWFTMDTEDPLFRKNHGW